MVVDNAGQSACVDAGLLAQDRTARKEDEFIINELGLARFVDITEDGIARAVDVIGDRGFGNGDVLRAGGSARGLGEINRLTGP